MELLIILSAVIGMFFGILGFCLSLFVIIENRAAAKSTHRVEMVPMTMSELRESTDELRDPEIDKFNKARIEALQDSDFQDII